MRHVVDKLRAGGANGVLVVERGTCFGHGDLVVDFRGLPGMRALGVPVCFDATHSSQHPPTDEGRTLGSRAHIRPLARAAVAVGADALFVEVHPDPEGAPSDASNMLPLGEFEAFAREMLQLRRALGSLDPREIAG
jgi:2-dehydro-3-deoxyphosphooctonate aldolase (KDO 8-P synthase)